MRLASTEERVFLNKKHLARRYPGLVECYRTESLRWGCACIPMYGFFVLGMTEIRKRGGGCSIAANTFICKYDLQNMVAELAKKVTQRKLEYNFRFLNVSNAMKSPNAIAEQWAVHKRLYNRQSGTKSRRVSLVKSKIEEEQFLSVKADPRHVFLRRYGFWPRSSDENKDDLHKVDKDDIKRLVQHNADTLLGLKPDHPTIIYSWSKYACNACRHTRKKSISMQLRACDEGETLIEICMDCQRML